MAEQGIPLEVRRLLATAEVGGEVEQLERLLRAQTSAHRVDAVAVVGDLGLPWSKADTYRSLFRALGRAELPVFWVPGQTDAPLQDHLSEAAGMEIVYPLVRCVHGTVALGPGPVLFAGLGGVVVDDLATIRADEVLLRSPGWEVHYRLKVIREFEEYPRVFLFWSRPAHKGHVQPGSEVLTEVINTYRPRLVIVAGDRPEQEQLGGTLVLCPGRFDQGSYAFVDLRDCSVEFAETAARPVGVGVF